MDINTRLEIINQLKHSSQAFKAAQETGDSGTAAIAATEWAQYALIFSGSPIPLTADPLEILKAAEKLSFEGRLNAMDITSPEVRRILGLPSSDVPWLAPFKGAEAEPSPIILDLDGDGIETIMVDNSVYFDHEGDGFAESTGWVGAHDGLLVWDRDGDGRINNGSAR